MRRAFMVIISIAAALQAIDAATLKERLVQNHENGQPIEGALVGAVGASQTKSVELGVFTLEFPRKKPGDPVELIVSYQGMVLVNWVQYKVNLPSDPDSNVLTLILSRDAEREKWARQFFKLKSVAEIEATFQTRLVKEGEQQRARLQGERDEALARRSYGFKSAAEIEVIFQERLAKEKEQQKARLQHERDEAIAAADRAAEELAKIRPGQASAFYEEAMRLFAEGKVDEALRVLDEARLKRASQAARERKEQAEKQLADAIQGWLLRGRLLTTKLQFAKAEEAYAARVS